MDKGDDNDKSLRFEEVEAYHIEPDNPVLQRLREYIERETGIAYNKGRVYQLANRVSARIRDGEFKSIEEYTRFVMGGFAGNAEMEKLLELLLIKETSFFRNEPQFHVLGEYIIPALLSNKSFEAQKEFKLWSAGCSTGQEPYSIAMIIKETVGEDDTWDFKIYSTDISRYALKKTDIGIYNATEVNDIPPELLEKYFYKRQDRYQVRDDIKTIIQPIYHNIMKEPPFGGLDIIFCRNILIYFSVPTIRKITNYLYEALADKGFLFLGHSESLYGITDRFRLVDFAGVLLYRKRF